MPGQYFTRHTRTVLVVTCYVAPFLTGYMYYLTRKTCVTYYVHLGLQRDDQLWSTTQLRASERGRLEVWRGYRTAG